MYFEDTIDEVKYCGHLFGLGSSLFQNGMPYEAGFNGLPLTKEAMARHNEEMEKEFMQQHRYKT